MRERRTKQKEQLYAYLNNQDQEVVSIKSMLDFFKDEIGQATIYRFISQMEKKGILIKCEGEGMYRFVDGDYGCHQHYHLLCQKCHRLYHIENQDIKPLLNCLNNQYGFHLDPQMTLNGLCQECYQKETNK